MMQALLIRISGITLTHWNRCCIQTWIKNQMSVCFGSSYS